MSEIKETQERIREALERCMDIREEMFQLVSEAEDLIRATEERDLETRSISYWIGHIRCALGSDNYSTYSFTMRDMLEELEERAYEEFDEEEA